MSVVIQRTDAQREDPPATPKHEVRAAAQAAKDARRREEQEYRDTLQKRRAAERAERRDATRQRLTETGRRAAFIAPLLLVTGFAVYGQIDYIIDHLAPPDWALLYRLILAVGAGLTIESISNYVQFQAHKSRLAGATAQAAKLSRASYLIAAGVAFINYQHFCADHLAPTPLALMFAGFSLSSPWLWSLHTRGVEHEQRVVDGTIDRGGAVFAAERRRNFPVHTWRARRYSLMHNITDPGAAWDAYMAEYRRGATAKAIERRQHRAERRATGWLGWWRGAKSGVTAGASAGATGGAKPGAGGGANPGAPDTSPGGATPGRTTDTSHPGDTTPTGRTSKVTTLVRHRALTPDEQTAMRVAATGWAVTRAIKDGGAVPGWRTIAGATDDRTGNPLFPGLTEYAAKAAAATAKDRVQGDDAPTRAAR